MSWIEVKTINKHDYFYLRWRDYLPDGSTIRRSKYIGKVQSEE